MRGCVYGKKKLKIKNQGANDLPFPSGASTGPSLPPTSACNRTWYEIARVVLDEAVGWDGRVGSFVTSAYSKCTVGFYFFSSPIWGTISAKLSPYPTPHPHFPIFISWGEVASAPSLVSVPSPAAQNPYFFFSPKSKD